MSSNLRSLFTVSPAVLPHHLETLFSAGLVPFLRSSPGMGKSAIFRQFAEDYNLVLIDIRLSMYEPVDFSGAPFPLEGRTRYLPTELFPLDGIDKIPEGKEGWLILLDEFTHAEPEMERAAFKLVLDRMVGQNKLHPNALVALAGNNIDDNALANNTSTALNSRVTHLSLATDPEFWTTEIATRLGFDHRVIGFIAANPNKLNDFDPEQDEHSFCSERTWEFVSNLIKGVPEVSGLSPLVAGTISPGVAAEFIQFCEIYKNLIYIKDVVKDPENCDLPADSPTRWALVTHLAGQVTKDNAAAVATFVDRMPLQYVVIFCRILSHQSIDLYTIPEIGKLYGRIGRAAK